MNHPYRFRLYHVNLDMITRHCVGFALWTPSKRNAQLFQDTEQRKALSSASLTQDRFNTRILFWTPLAWLSYLEIINMHKVIDVNLRNLIWDSVDSYCRNTRIYNPNLLQSTCACSLSNLYHVANASRSCLKRWKLRFYCDVSSLGGFQQCYGRAFSTITGRWNISQARSVKYLCSARRSTKKTHNIWARVCLSDPKC